jgi:prepilin-type N-terminal cleavage/methylation domain-containing protein
LINQTIFDIANLNLKRNCEMEWATSVSVNKVIRRTGFTLVEFVVSMTIVGMMMSLLLMGIQFARETARRTSCLNNARNLALGGVNFESVFRQMPSPHFDALPTSVSYRSDSGLFVSMLPYIDEGSLHQQFAQGEPSPSSRNKETLLKRPPVLKCPSTGTSAKLTNIAERWNGIAVPELGSITCDYVGNGGAIVDNLNTVGSVIIQIAGKTPYRRLRDITDGSSHTLWFWESIGDRLYRPERAIDLDLYARRVVFFHINESRDRIYSLTQASTKSYLYGWTGIRNGAIYSYDFDGNVLGGNNAKNGRVINVSNEFCEPYSAHPSVVNACFVDTSTRSISAAISASVMLSWASAHHGDSIPYED